MIDLHCHVLPGVDDGPTTVEAAVALVRQAGDNGTTTIAATPHVDHGHRHLDSQTIGAAVRELQARLDAEHVDVTIVPGAEVGSTWAAELDDAELRRLTLGGAGWLLLECPLSPTLTPGFMRIARRLAARGHRLLLAHPERSPLFLRSPALLDELVAEGMLAQVTAGALSGRFGGTVRDRALELVDREAIHVAASDAHDETRPAIIAGDLNEAGIEPGLMAWLACEVPAAILAGGDLPARPSAARGRRRGLPLPSVGRH